MKKIFALAIAVVMALALAVPAFAHTAQEPSDKTAEFPKVAAGSITIDGVKDAAYDNACVIDAVEQNLENWDESPCNTSAKLWACWDGAYIYVYAECNDNDIFTDHEGEASDIWSGDHLGIIIDFDNNKTSEYAYNWADNGDHIVYINIAADGDTNFFTGYHMIADDMPYYNLVATKAIIDDAAGKIIYEAKLPCPVSEVEIKDGMKVGFEVGFTNATTADEKRMGNVTWSEHGADMWKWSHCCGTVTLLAEGAAAPAPAPAPEAPATPAPEAPVAPSNPSTADVSVLFYALASISAVGGVALINKRK